MMHLLKDAFQKAGMLGRHGAIKLRNGHVIDIGWAAGAMGFRGDGYAWEQPFRIAGLLRPDEMTIFTKTITRHGRKGNYQWWRPWRCLRSLGRGNFVNAVGLTDPYGIRGWMTKCHPHIQRRGYKVVASILADTAENTRHICAELNCTSNVIAVELNPFCPNVHFSIGEQSTHACRMFDAARKGTSLPIGIKFGWHDEFEACCKALDGQAAFFDLINSVPWRFALPSRISPLNAYGYDGSVSGPMIKNFARDALIRAKRAATITPIASGGGVDSVEEAVFRYLLGADTVMIGVKALSDPTAPNRIANRLRAVLDDIYGVDRATSIGIRNLHESTKPYAVNIQSF